MTIGPLLRKSRSSTLYNYGIYQGCADPAVQQVLSGAASQKLGFGIPKHLLLRLPGSASSQWVSLNLSLPPHAFPPLTDLLVQMDLSRRLPGVEL